MKFYFLLLYLIPFTTLSQSSESAPKLLQNSSTFIPVTPSVKQIQLQTGIHVEYIEQGDTTGIPIILLHGFTDSWKSFELTMQHLPASFHVLAISHRGHGNSSKPSSTYRTEDFANDLHAFIRAKKLGDAIIVGHSMSGVIAQCFAIRYPQLTKALVLIGSFATYDNSAVRELKTVIEEMKEPVDVQFVQSFQESTVAKPLSPTILQTFVDESMKLPVYVWKSVSQAWSSVNYLEALQNFTKPALLVWGDKDPFAPKKDQQALQKALVGARLLEYKGTGHANHWEEPARFASDLVAFIQNDVSNHYSLKLKK